MRSLKSAQSGGKRGECAIGSTPAALSRKCFRLCIPIEQPHRTADIADDYLTTMMPASRVAAPLQASNEPRTITTVSLVARFPGGLPMILAAAAGIDSASSEGAVIGRPTKKPRASGGLERGAIGARRRGARILRAQQSTTATAGSFPSKTKRPPSAPQKSPCAKRNASAGQIGALGLGAKKARPSNQTLSRHSRRKQLAGCGIGNKQVTDGVKTPDEKHPCRWRGGLPTSSQGHCGALTPQSGGAPSPLFWSVPPCSFRQPRNGAVLRCAAPPSG